MADDVVPLYSAACIVAEDQVLGPAPRGRPRIAVAHSRGAGAIWQEAAYRDHLIAQLGGERRPRLQSRMHDAHGPKLGGQAHVQRPLAQPCHLVGSKRRGPRLVLGRARRRRRVRRAPIQPTKEARLRWEGERVRVRECERARVSARMTSWLPRTASTERSLLESQSART